MMFDKKALSLVAVGGLLLAGCGVDGEESPTPTPTAAPTPQQLNIDSDFISVTCDGANWGIDAIVDGWTDGAEFSIYEYTTYCDSYDSNPGNGTVDNPGVCYREHHPMHSDAAYTEGGYYEELSLDLDNVAKIADVVAGSKTLFNCDNEAKLTYVMCADDYNYETGTQCAWFGNEPAYWEANGRMSHM